jgi:hypothetical protein
VIGLGDQFLCACVLGNVLGFTPVVGLKPRMRTIQLLAARVAIHSLTVVTMNSVATLKVSAVTEFIATPQKVVREQFHC